MKPGLTRLQILLILVAALAVFFFIQGPIWRRPWEIDRSVWYSYFIIPALVAAVLLVSRRWSLGGFLLGSFEIVLFKFGITYVAATILWASAGEPPRPAPLPIAASAPAEPPRPPTPIPPGTTGVVEGTAAPGALVYVEAGLERFVFAPPREPAHLENGGAGFTPPIVAVEVGQPLLARSTDGRTHTLHAREDTTGALRNIAVLASGQPRSIRFSRPLGLVRVQCAVHPAEPASYMAVLGHPFFAFADAGGRFRFEGVPAEKLRVAAFAPPTGRKAADVELHPGQTAAVTLR